MAPRLDYRCREILYQLSPYQQNIIGQAFVNAPSTFLHFVKTKGRGYATTAVVYFGALGWIHGEMEKEKLAARY